MWLLLHGCVAPGPGTIEAEPRPVDVTDSQQANDHTGGALDSDPDDHPIEFVDGEEAPGAFDVDIVPHGAGFTGSLEVTLDLSEDAEVWYTLDDSVPVPGLSTLYTGPLLLTDTATLRVLAVATDGRQDHDSAAFASLSPGVVDLVSEIPLMVLVGERTLPDDKGDGYIPFQLLTFDQKDGANALGTATLSTRGAIKVRGSSTAGYAKHSWGYETWEHDRDDDKDRELLGLAAESDWVFLAPFAFDRAFMRDAFAYWMSNTIGAWAPHTRFFELFASEGGEQVSEDDYMGVYVLVERIKQGENRVDIAALGPGDLDEPEVTGGYVFKRDRLGDGESGFWAGTGGGAWSFQQYLAYVDPDEEDLAPQQKSYLSSAIDEFGYALAASDGVNPVTGAHYSELIDIDSWIDHHLVNTFTMNPDALRLSGYLYKEREGPIHAGPVWDFDRTMGCDSDSRCLDPVTWDAGHITSDTTYVFEHGWYKGLLDDPEFTEAYWDRWREVLQGPLAVDVLLDQLDAWEALLDEAAERNFERWPDYQPDGSFGNEVDQLRAWVEGRHTWISLCLGTDDPELCTSG